jgi:tetratricopeptide (TPR) repeat protein
MSTVDKTVFISYRRSTSKYIAAYVFNDLRQHEFDVFWDVSSINSGRFESILFNQIAARTHFVVILTPGTLTSCINPDGSENNVDWLRREIERAIELQRNVVPVLLEGFTFQDNEKYLTGKLSSLAHYNALEVPWMYLEEAMTRLRTRYLKPPAQPVDIRHSPPSERTSIERRMVEAVNRPLPSQSQLNAEVYFSQGLQHHDNHDYNNAILDYGKAIHLNPQDADLYYYRGNAFEGQGDLANAIKDYQKYLDLGGGVQNGDQEWVEKIIQKVKKRIHQQMNNRQ